MAKRTMKDLLETKQTQNEVSEQSIALLQEILGNDEGPEVLREAANRSLARIHQHVQDRNIGIITAHRGGNATPEDRARNNKRNAELANDIHKAGYGYVHVRGRYIENHGTENARHVDEHSYMVIGKKGDDKGALKNFLTKHGEKYEQDSILHKPHNSSKATLHGTKEGAWPGKGKTHEVGEFHPNRAGEFHSVMKGRGKTFAFEEYHYLNPRSFSRRKESLF